MKPKAIKYLLCLSLMCAFLLFPAFSAQAEPAFIEIENGTYAIAVDVEGGSGKASVTSPCTLIVENGQAQAKLVWSSSNYDYMIVDGQKYLNESDPDSYSTFTIPITVFDAPMPVIADTTAMSEAHEIEYQLYFHSDEIMESSQTPQEAAKRVVYMVAAIGAVCVFASIMKTRRQRR